MEPKPHKEEPSELFQQDLKHLLDQRQPLYQLANQLPNGTVFPERHTRCRAETQPRRSYLKSQKVDQRASFALALMLGRIEHEGRTYQQIKIHS